MQLHRRLWQQCPWWSCHNQPCRYFWSCSSLVHQSFWSCPNHVYQSFWSSCSKAGGDFPRIFLPLPSLPLLSFSSVSFFISYGRSTSHSPPPLSLLLRLFFLLFLFAPFFPFSFPSFHFLPSFFFLFFIPFHAHRVVSCVCRAVPYRAISHRVVSYRTMCLASSSPMVSPFHSTVCSPLLPCFSQWSLPLHSPAAATMKDGPGLRNASDSRPSGTPSSVPTFPSTATIMPPHTLAVESETKRSCTLEVETEMPPPGKKRRRDLMKELAPDLGYVDHAPSSPARKRKPTNFFNPDLGTHISQLEVHVTPAVASTSVKVPTNAEPRGRTLALEGSSQDSAAATNVPSFPSRGRPIQTTWKHHPVALSPPPTHRHAFPFDFLFHFCFPLV